MANYAFRPRSLNNSYPRQRVSQMSPLTQYNYDVEPDEAFQQWLSWLNPSTAHRGQLNSMRNEMYNQYGSHELLGLSGFGGYEGPSMSFFDYLTRLNPQREVYRQSPYARGADTRRFRQPARWTSF